MMNRSRNLLLENIYLQAVVECIIVASLLLLASPLMVLASDKEQPSVHVAHLTTKPIK